METIILVLDHFDTSLRSFHQVFPPPQASANTLLWIARSGHYQGLHASYALQSELCGLLISHLTQWTWPLVICTLWPCGCHGDHTFDMRCKVFVLCQALLRPFLRVPSCPRCISSWSCPWRARWPCLVARGRQCRNRVLHGLAAAWPWPRSSPEHIRAPPVAIKR